MVERTDIAREKKWSNMYPAQLQRAYRIMLHEGNRNLSPREIEVALLAALPAPPERIERTLLAARLLWRATRSGLIVTIRGDLEFTDAIEVLGRVTEITDWWTPGEDVRVRARISRYDITTKRRPVIPRRQVTQWLEDRVFPDQAPGAHSLKVHGCPDVYIDRWNEDGTPGQMIPGVEVEFDVPAQSYLTLQRRGLGKVRRYGMGLPVPVEVLHRAQNNEY